MTKITKLPNKAEYRYGEGVGQIVTEDNIRKYLRLSKPFSDMSTETRDGYILLYLSNLELITQS